MPTWSHFILTAYPHFERLINKQADRRRKLYNGRIECTFYQFHGPKPSDGIPISERQTSPEIASPEGQRPTTQPVQPVSTPVFGGLSPKAFEQAELFRSRLKKRARHLRRWPTHRGITCYRLYDRDIPEVPLVVDRYEDHLHISEYERPHDRDLAQHADWLELMTRTAREVLEVSPQHVFCKYRERQRGTLQHEHVADQRYEIIVCEGGLKFLVNLSDYVDTGLFLDHRITRGMVREQTQGKSFLNLFGYTGAFTVYAASGGATRTTTVDWNPVYLEWAEKNMTLNAFPQRPHQFVRADARQFLASQPQLATFDVAVVDPPTYSNSKRSDDDWRVQRDHAHLINQLMPLMRAGGIVYFSTNFRQFKFDADKIQAPGIHEISRQTVPEDFRNQRIHRCWRIEC